MNLAVIFITGLTVGGLTCLAVQGGLLASVIASREGEIKKDKKRHALVATSIFIAAKFVAYTLLGFLLGAFGGALKISDTIQTTMQLLAGIYMILVALNLLDVHPIFRYVVIQPPRSLTRLVRNQSKSKDIFAPALLGLMTIFIPCGTTLAMEALAISSANAFSGAAIMAAFILGTIPLFFGIGFITSMLGDAFRSTFLKLAAFAVIYLGIVSINGALVAFGSAVTFQSLLGLTSSGPSKSDALSMSSFNNNVEITISSSGYQPDYIRVAKGKPVTLTVFNKDSFSCASAFRIPSLGLGANVAPNQRQTFTFTPATTGTIPFSCSMGMYKGIIEVI